MLRNLFNKKKREAGEKFHSQTLSSMAVRPATVNAEWLIGEVTQTLIEYIESFYNLNSDNLPMHKMEEQFYYEAVRRVYVVTNSLEQKNITARRTTQLQVENITLEDYDNRVRYAVTSLTYRAIYHITGISRQGNIEEPFNHSGKLLCQFDYDGRMGWLLSKVEELP